VSVAAFIRVVIIEVLEGSVFVAAPEEASLFYTRSEYKWLRPDSSAGHVHISAEVDHSRYNLLEETRIAWQLFSDACLASTKRFYLARALCEFGDHVISNLLNEARRFLQNQLVSLGFHHGDARLANGGRDTPIAITEAHLCGYLTDELITRNPIRILDEDGNDTGRTVAWKRRRKAKGNAA
jgi:hypothetical protein